MTRIAVVGAGSWGTVLSAILSRKGHDVFLWAFEPEVAEQITRGRENVSYLSGIELPKTCNAQRISQRWFKAPKSSYR